MGDVMRELKEFWFVVGCGLPFILIGLAVVLAFKKRHKLKFQSKKFARSYRTNKAWRS